MTTRQAPAPSPAVQLDTHAGMDGAPLCGQPAGQQVTAGWAAVTCADCQLAAPAPAPGGFDGTDLAVLAEAQVLVILAAAAPQPQRLYDVMLCADPAYRAAILPALDRLATQDCLEETGPPGSQQRWRLAAGPAGLR